MEPALAQFDKIQILLHEYDTLRNALLARYSAQFKAVGVLALVLTGLVTVIATNGLNKILVGLVGSSVVIFILVILWIDYDIARAAKRVREIETDINARAGEPLLTWETHWGPGGIAMRYFVEGAPKPIPAQGDKNSN